MLKNRKQTDKCPIVMVRSMQQTRSSFAHIFGTVEFQYSCPMFELVRADSVPCRTAEDILLDTITSERGYKEIGTSLFQD